MKIKNKINVQNFSWFGLLLGVLILCLLALIIKPKYQMMTAKAQFSKLKEYTQNLADLILKHDIFNTTSEETKKYDINFTPLTNIDCNVYEKSHFIKCCDSIFNTKTCYYFDVDNYLPKYCSIESTNKSDKPNLLCQQETKKNDTKAYCIHNKCTYSYQHNI